MSIATLYQIVNYYDNYKDIDITLTSSNIEALKLLPKYVLLKYKDLLCHCIIHTTSMKSASVILPSDSELFRALNDEHDNVSIKYCFLDSNNNPIVFFVSSYIANIKDYDLSKGLKMLLLNFNERPSHDLILRLGVFAQVLSNSQKYYDKNIELTTFSLWELNIDTNNTFALIFGVPRKCIIKSISFTTACIVSVGLPKYLLDKTIKLDFNFTDTSETISIGGVIKNASCIEGRKDICKIDVVFNEKEIPFTYKLHLNRYLVNNKLVNK